MFFARSLSRRSRSGISSPGVQLGLGGGPDVNASSSLGGIGYARVAAELEADPDPPGLGPDLATGG